jgi:hypothetical protein
MLVTLTISAGLYFSLLVAAASYLHSQTLKNQLSISVRHMRSSNANDHLIIDFNVPVLVQCKYQHSIDTVPSNVMQ